MRFVFEVWPLNISIPPFETLKDFEMILSNSRLAAPATGGELSLILNLPFYSPQIPDPFERGTTRTSKTIDS